MTIYTGLCIGGPHDGEMLAHDGTVYRMPIRSPSIPPVVRASLRVHPSPVTEFVYVRSVARLGAADLPIWKPVDQTDDQTVETLCAGYGCRHGLGRVRRGLRRGAATEEAPVAAPIALSVLPAKDIEDIRSAIETLEPGRYSTFTAKTGWRA